MGEAYKGLTIQIGADTTKLTAALRNVNKAALSTQRALKRIDGGLSKDPANLSLMSAKLADLAERSGAVAVKMRLMREQMAQMRGSGIEKALDSTKNLALRAASASDEYARLVRQISEVRTAAATDWGWSQSDINDPDKKKEIDQRIAALARESAEYSKMNAVLKGLQQRLVVATKELDDVGKMQSLKRLREDFKLAESEAKVLAREFVDVREQMLAIGKTRPLQSVNSELAKSKDIADQVEAEFKQIEEALSMNPRSVDAIARKLSNISEQSAVAERRLAQLNAKMAQLKAAGATSSAKGMAQLAQEAQSARSRVEQLRERIENVNSNIRLASESAEEFSKKLDMSGAAKAQARVEKLRAVAVKLEAELERADSAFDAAHMSRELRQVETEIIRTNAQLKNFSKLAKTSSGSMTGAFFAMRTAGYTLSATVGSAVSAVGYSIVSKAEEIDSAFRDMKKTVNGTDEQFAQLRQDAIEYSKTHFTSADTLLEVEAMAGQLGIAAENLEEFSTTVSNLDIATDMDAEDIAIDLGKLSNVLSDLDESNVSNFADALVRLGNNNAALESDIMNITTRFGGMASQVGMSADEILAWGTAASATGVKAESAGSNMLKTLGNINGAVSAGGKKLDAWSKIIGMSADEIKEKWGDGKGGTNEVFKSFITTLSKMKKTDIDASLLDIGITSVRQRQLIEGLTQSVGNMDDVLKMSKDAWNGVSDEWGNAGDAAYEAQQKSEGFSGAMAIMRNNLAAIADSIGTDLVPYIQKATDAIKTFGDWYNNLSDDGKKTLLNAAVALTALGPGLTVVASMGGGLSTAGKMLGNLGEKAATAAAKWQMLKGGMDATEAVASDAGNVVSFAAKSAEQGAKSAEKAAGSTKKLNASLLTTMTTLNTVSVGIGVFAVAIAAAAGEVAHIVSEYREMDKATSTSSGDVLKSWGIDPSDTKKSARSLSQLREANYELAKSMNTSNSEIRSSITDTKASASMLDKYGATVERISKKARKNKITKVSELSDKDLGALKSALDGINEVMGTDYKPVDIIAKGQADEAKKVNDELQKSIALKKLSMQQDAMSDAYKQKYTEQMTAADNLAQAQKKVNDAMKKRQDLAASGNGVGAEAEQAQAEYEQAMSEFERAQQLYDASKLDSEKYQKAVEFLSAAQQKGGKSISALVADNAQAFAQLSSGGQLSSFTSALKSVGITYKGLTDDQKNNTEWLAQLAASYDGTTASLVSGLDQLGVSYKAASADFAVAKENVKSALDTLGGDATAKLKGSYGSVSNFLKALKDAGYEYDQLKNLTPIQWESILNSGDLGSKAKGISDELKGALDSALKESVDANIKVDADTSSADKKLKDTSSSVDELSKKEAKPTADLDTSAFDSAATNVQSEISRLNGQTVTIYTQTKKKGSGGGGTWQGPVITESSEPSRPVVFSTMSLDASRAVAQLDSAFAASQYSVSDMSSGVDEMASRSRKTYRAASSAQTAVLDKDAMAALKAIAKNTKGGKGLYLDGNKLVGGTADRYDTTMARRERLAKRGLDI